MSSRIDITINDTRLEVEYTSELAEPENAVLGYFEIIALRTLDHRNYDVWPIIGEIAGVEDEILAAIEREGNRS